MNVYELKTWRQADVLTKDEMQARYEKLVVSDLEDMLEKSVRLEARFEECVKNALEPIEAHLHARTLAAAQKTVKNIKKCIALREYYKCVLSGEQTPSAASSTADDTFSYMSSWQQSDALTKDEMQDRYERLCAADLDATIEKLLRISSEANALLNDTSSETAKSLCMRTVIMSAETIKVLMERTKLRDGYRAILDQ